MPTDDELIKEIRDGSQAAMEVLIKRHYNSIFSYVYRKVGEQHSAYDLTQEVFIKMMKAISSFHAKGDFKNWLYKIATHTCYDYFRSNMYKKMKVEVELDTSLPDENEHVFAYLDRKLDRQKMKNAIDELPSYQKDAIILKFYHDLKIKDIANVTECKEATVKSRLRQGLAKLKEILEGGEKYSETKSRI